MSFIKTLRNSLGISQTALATLINSTLGAVAMAEIGHRHLSLRVEPLLSALERASLEAINNPKPIVLSNEQLNKLMNRIIREKGASKKLLLLKEERLDMQMQQVQHLQQVANLLEANPSFTQDNIVGLQLKLLKRKARIKQQALQLQLAKLSIDVASLEASIAKANEMKQ